MSGKLTIEYIAPYLPYKILMKRPKMFIPNLKEASKIPGLIYLTGDLYADLENETYGIYGKDFKPLLIPLDKITDNVAGWIKAKSIMRFGNDSLEYIKWWLCEMFKTPDEIPLIIANKIFELHGDFFGLITKGLAIDKTLTLPVSRD